MNFLENQLKKMSGLFVKGKPLGRLRPLFEAVDTFLLTPGTTARAAPYIRDAVDLKRVMFLVMIALMPCLFAGIFNIIISIGPFLSGATISIFILSIAGLPKAIIFLVAFLVAQQIEGAVIMPLLSKKFLNLSPSLVLISLLVGAKLWGLMGAILVIPLVGMFFELTKGFLENRQVAELTEQNSL